MVFKVQSHTAGDHGELNDVQKFLSSSLIKQTPLSQLGLVKDAQVKKKKRKIALAR